MEFTLWGIWRNFLLSYCHTVCPYGHLSLPHPLGRSTLRRRNSQMANLCITLRVECSCHDPWKLSTSWKKIYENQCSHYCCHPCTGSVAQMPPEYYSLPNALAWGCFILFYFYFCHLDNIPDINSLVEEILLLVHGFNSVGPGLAPWLQPAAKHHIR